MYAVNICHILLADYYEIICLQTFADINYYHCQQIIEILKETEADTRSLFGRYGSQRMKDWQVPLKKNTNYSLNLI